MYRSYYVVWVGAAGWKQREDFGRFAEAFDCYVKQEQSELWGVDRLDCSHLLGSRGLSVGKAGYQLVR